MSARKIKNSWWIDFRHEHERYRFKSPDNSYAGASAYEAAVRQRLARGEPAIPESKTAIPTFTLFSAEWLSTYVKTNNKFSEQQQKAMAIRNHLGPAFGRLHLNEITPRGVEEYKATKLRAGLGPKTINNQLTILAKCLVTAVEFGLLEHAPKMKKLKVPDPETDYLTEAERDDLLHRCTNQKLREMILVAIYTGLRLGELCALRWEDMDFDRGIITVRRNVVLGLEGTPKNGRTRHVPIASILRQTLLPRVERGGLVFSREAGFVSKAMAWHRLNRYCASIGFRHIGWHTFRHSFASHLIAKGLPETVVQRLLGHSTIVMTMRYSHVSPTSLQDAIRILETDGMTGPRQKVGQPVGNAPRPAPVIHSSRRSQRLGFSAP